MRALVADMKTAISSEGTAGGMMLSFLPCASRELSVSPICFREFIFPAKSFRESSVMRQVLELVWIKLAPCDEVNGSEHRPLRVLVS